MYQLKYLCKLSAQEPFMYPKRCLNHIPDFPDRKHDDRNLNHGMRDKNHSEIGTLTHRARL